jgi:hypothetical protein
MSKAELFQQLETLTPDELNQVAVRIEELRELHEVDDVTDEERRILDERIARAKTNPQPREDWAVVRDRVMKKLKNP